MDKYVRAARELPEPWDRLREQRVLEELVERLEEVDDLEERAAPRSPRGRGFLAAAVGGVLLVSGALIWVLLRQDGAPLAPSSPLSGGVASVPGPDPTSNTSLIRFADGSEAVVYSGGRVVVRDQHATRILLDQLAGAALFRVVPNRSRRFEVVAEGVTIRVVGTRFKVTLVPARWVRVEVEQGLVEVEYEGQTVRLGAGDSLRVNRDSLARTGAAVVPAPTTTPASTPASTPAMAPPRLSPPRATPHSTTSRVPVMAPTTPASAATPTPAPPPARPAAEVAKAQRQERDWIAATMRQVDAARRGGRHAEAVRLIRALIARYPHNWRVSTAAFMLARIEHARRRYAAAAKAYALYRRRSPHGPLAEDALAGEARARRAAGQKNLARKLARTYLKKYPRGTHAKAMRSAMR